MQITNIICGEYSPFYLTDSNSILTPQWNQSTVTTQSLPISGLPSTIVSGASGIHSALFIDTSSNVWTIWDNTYGEQGSGVTGGSGAPYQILKDANGNAFTGIIFVASYMYANYAVKKDGTVWYWGQDLLGVFGGNVLTPKQLVFPSGVSITKIAEGTNPLFLDTTGTVWIWTVNSKTPTKVVLPGPATQITQSSLGIYIAVVNGYPYGWGASQWGVTSTPTSLQKQWNITSPVVQIVGNDNTIHYIDSAGALWGVGDDAMGEVGDGHEINYSVVTPPNGLYAWSWARYQKMVTTPINIVPGTKFTKICTQNAYAFYVYAKDSAGNWWSWGRNKADVLGNNISLNSDLASEYPNLADQPIPAIVTPLTMSANPYLTYLQFQQIYATNTGYPIPGSTTTSSTTSSTSTSTSTTTSSTTTTSTTKAPYITLYKDGTWVLD